MDFYQFYNQINGGKPYENGDNEPPASYNFLDYVSQLTKSPVNGTENGTWDLTPLTQDDMLRYASLDASGEANLDLN